MKRNPEKISRFYNESCGSRIDGKAKRRGMATRKEETSEHAFRNLCILLCGGDRMNRLDEGWITSPDVYFHVPDVYFHVPDVVDYVPGRIFFYFEPIDDYFRMYHYYHVSNLLTLRPELTDTTSRTYQRGISTPKRSRGAALISESAAPHHPIYSLN